jgi:hypothetical protein
MGGTEKAYKHLIQQLTIILQFTEMQCMRFGFAEVFFGKKAVYFGYGIGSRNTDNTQRPNTWRCGYSGYGILCMCDEHKNCKVQNYLLLSHKTGRKK